MRRRRDILKGLLALVLAPAGLAGLGGPPAAGAARGAGFHLVNGWILTDRDLAALAALDRALT